MATVLVSLHFSWAFDTIKWPWTFVREFTVDLMMWLLIFNRLVSLNFVKIHIHNALFVLFNTLEARGMVD